MAPATSTTALVLAIVGALTLVPPTNAAYVRVCGLAENLNFYVSYQETVYIWMYGLATTPPFSRCYTTTAHIMSAYNEYSDYTVSLGYRYYHDGGDGSTVDFRSVTLIRGYDNHYINSTACVPDIANAYETIMTVQCRTYDGCVFFSESVCTVIEVEGSDAPVDGNTSSGSAGWEWIVIGLCCGLAVAAIVVGATWYYNRRRANKLKVSPYTTSVGPYTVNEPLLTGA